MRCKCEAIQLEDHSTSSNECVLYTDSVETPISPSSLTGGSGVVVATTLIRANGDYSFDDLTASYYSGEESRRVGFLDVSNIDGGAINSINVTLGAANPLNSTGNDCVDERDRIVTGVAFDNINDANCGEGPIPGVTLSLVDGNNTGSSRYDDYRLERCVQLRRSPYWRVHCCRDERKWFRFRRCDRHRWQRGP